MGIDLVRRARSGARSTKKVLYSTVDYVVHAMLAELVAQECGRLETIGVDVQLRNILKCLVSKEIDNW